MTTALSAYPVSANSTTLTNAALLTAVTGGTSTSNAQTINASTGWGQIDIGAITTWLSGGSIGSPDGHGGLYDGGFSALTGQTIGAGNWSASIPFFVSQVGASISGALVLRFYKYNSSSHAYTSIGSITVAGQTITNTSATINFPNTSLPAMSFSSNETLYCDLWMNITSTTLTSGGGLAFVYSASTTLGYSGSGITTPGYAASSTPVTKSVPVRTRVRTNAFKSVPLRTRIRTNTLKSIALRTRVIGGSTPVLKSVPLRTRIRTANARSLPLKTMVASTSRRSLAIRTVVRNPNASYVVIIDGKEIKPSAIERTLCVIAGSLVIDSTIGKRSTASFSVHSGSDVHFQQYQQVQIYDKANTLAFSGYITQPKEIKPGFRPTLTHQITCIDQHWLADKRVVAATFANKTCGFIAKWLLDNVLAEEGVTIGQIYDGPVPSPSLYPSPDLYPGGNVGIIPGCTFVYCPVSQAMDSLVTAASTSGIPYYWQIDQNKKLWFVPYTAVVNTNIVDGTSIEQNINPPSVTRQNPSYRNTQYVTGGVAETLSQTENRVGDGTAQSWTMGYDLAHVPTVSVNIGSGYVVKTVGIKGVDSSKDFYWNAGDPTITQDSSGTILRGTPSNDMLKVAYIGQFPTIIIGQDSGQIAYQASMDGTTGIVESVQQDGTITSAANGMSLVSQLLNRYGTQALQLQFTTRDPSYSQGQLITVDMPDFDLNNAQLLISDVSASDQNDGVNIYFTATAVLNAYDVTWVDFFSTILKQQTPPNSINIGVSQVLTIAATMTADFGTSATFNMTVVPALLPGPTVYPSTTRYPG